MLDQTIYFFSVILYRGIDKLSLPFPYFFFGNILGVLGVSSTVPLRCCMCWFVPLNILCAGIYAALTLTWHSISSNLLLVLKLPLQYTVCFPSSDCLLRELRIESQLAWSPFGEGFLLLLLVLVICQINPYHHMLMPISISGHGSSFQRSPEFRISSLFLYQVMQGSNAIQVYISFSSLCPPPIKRASCH